MLVALAQFVVPHLILLQLPLEMVLAHLIQLQLPLEMALHLDLERFHGFQLDQVQPDQDLLPLKPAKDHAKYPKISK